METLEIVKTKKPRNKKVQLEHISTLKAAFSKALRVSHQYQTSIERFEVARKKHEAQLVGKKQAAADAWKAVAEAATAANVVYAG